MNIIQIKQKIDIISALTTISQNNFVIRKMIIRVRHLSGQIYDK